MVHSSALCAVCAAPRTVLAAVSYKKITTGTAQVPVQVCCTPQVPWVPAYLHTVELLRGPRRALHTSLSPSLHTRVPAGCLQVEGSAIHTYALIRPAPQKVSLREHAPARWLT